MYPTLRQKLHFMWLVVMNADRMLKRCNSHGDISKLIDHATDRRAVLELPMHRISDTRKVRQMALAIANNTGGTYVPDNEEIKWEPY